MPDGVMCDFLSIRKVSEGRKAAILRLALAGRGRRYSFMLDGVMFFCQSVWAPEGRKGAVLRLALDGQGGVAGLCKTLRGAVSCQSVGA